MQKMALSHHNYSLAISFLLMTFIMLWQFIQSQHQIDEFSRIVSLRGILVCLPQGARKQQKKH